MGENLSRQETAALWDERWKSGERLWDHGRAAPPFAEFVERHGAPRGEILIPGPGSGHDVRYFASLGATVTGLDVSAVATHVAGKENPHPRARYITGNFLDPDTTLHARFDWLIEHTCLCSMNPRLWKNYAVSVGKLLKSGGHFLAIFYRNPAGNPGSPYGIDEDSIEELFGKHFELLDAWIPEKSYASRAGREELRWYRYNCG